MSELWNNHKHVNWGTTLAIQGIFCLRQTRDVIADWRAANAMLCLASLSLSLQRLRSAGGQQPAPARRVHCHLDRFLTPLWWSASWQPDPSRHLGADHPILIGGTWLAVTWAPCWGPQQERGAPRRRTGTTGPTYLGLPALRASFTAQQNPSIHCRQRQLGISGQSPVQPSCATTLKNNKDLVTGNSLISA